MRTFGQDKRVLMWDLYNEPGNSGMGNRSLPLVEATFAGPGGPSVSAVDHEPLGRTRRDQPAATGTVRRDQFPLLRQLPTAAAAD